MTRVPTMASLTVAAVLTLAGTASAQVAPDQPSTAETMAEHIRAAHGPFSERVEIDPYGRRLVHFPTRKRFDDVWNYYKAAYANQSVLPGGVTCGGYSIFEQRRIATFTLFQGGDRWLVEMYEDPDGARVVLYDVHFRRPPPRRGPGAAGMRAFHRAHPPVQFVRYGL